MVLGCGFPGYSPGGVAASGISTTCGSGGTPLSVELTSYSAFHADPLFKGAGPPGEEREEGEIKGRKREKRDRKGKGGEGQGSYRIGVEKRRLGSLFVLLLVSHFITITYHSN